MTIVMYSDSPNVIASLTQENETLRSENARLRLALTDAHDVTAEARAQMKRDVLATIRGVKTPEGYDWSERGTVDEHTARVISAIEVL